MILLALAFVLIVLLVIDHKQTLNIKKHPNLHEINVILSKHPSDSAINPYFVLATFAIIALAYFMPEVWGAVWLGVWIAVEGYVINNNRKLGL